MLFDIPLWLDEWDGFIIELFLLGDVVGLEGFSQSLASVFATAGKVIRTK